MVIQLVFHHDFQSFLFVFQIPSQEVNTKIDPLVLSYATVVATFLHLSDNHFLSTLVNDNADTFAAAILISYCHFSFLISSSMVMSTIYTSFNRFFQKCNGSSDERVVSMTKIEYGCSYISKQSLKTIKVNIRWMISLLKLLFVWNLHDVMFSFTSFDTWKYDCVMNTKKIIHLLPLKNDSVISAIIPSSTISNHIIKHYQQFSFLSRIILFDTFADILMHPYVNTFWPGCSYLFMRYWYLSSNGSLTQIKKLLSISTLS